ncbi:Putative transmembrane protein (PGPGW) [Propionibacterium cyclohexanicum]|uniref:Putative transmembrane protein (PGPGW) n=1 Tax=Propionibacterium cyclohexanicum TaxID=64702 RepID=A0A1H9TF40_9ACTN|nr:PGPGW domain-containing protein [Propionibacterium cyclohexanicum]SER95667.1 Putative transmembrane protein (PGPGW) [Propionibacterium cyclohexanicum]
MSAAEMSAVRPASCPASTSSAPRGTASAGTAPTGTAPTSGGPASPGARVRPPGRLTPHGIRPALPRQDIPRRERFAWRARIRANPATLLVYRTGVGAFGTSLVIASLLLGWLPGPGGTPLMLAGLAVLASEFRWAHILTVQAMRFLRQLRRLPTPVQALFFTAVGVMVALAAWLGLVIVGVPDWLPGWLGAALGHLPGVPG